MAGSRSPMTEFGAEIERVEGELVSRSSGGTLTRVFDDIPNREEDINYFKAEMSKLFHDQMTGQKPIDVTIKNIEDLQKIINECAQAVILNDPAIQRALQTISDENQRHECQRDIVVAYVNKLTAKVNTDARMKANIAPGSEQDRNVKAYMDFVRRVQNLHDQSPNIALMEIRKNATKELAEVLKSSRAALLSKKIDLSSSGEIVPDAAKPATSSSSPKTARRNEMESYAGLKQRLDRSSPRSVLTSSTGAAAAAAAAADTPHALKDEKRPMERAKSPPPSSMRRK